VDYTLNLLLEKDMPGLLPKTIRQKLDSTMLRLGSKPANMDLHHQANIELMGLKDKSGPMFNLEFV